MENRNISFGREIANRQRKNKVKINVTEKLLAYADFLNFFKRRLVSKLFWGRSSYYKNVSHIVISFITLVIVISGAIYKIEGSSSNVRRTIQLGENIPGQEDLLEQGGSIETVLVSSANFDGLQVKQYKVEKGDTIPSLAKKFGISENTIRGVNFNVGSIAFSDALEEGWILKIPSINGYVHNVRQGDTLDSIIAEANVTNSEANKFNIIEFNNLKPPYDLSNIQNLFIPDGNRDLRPQGSLEIPRGVFIDPLSNPSCGGYTFSRGFLPYHNGVDLAKWDGCIISSVANGVVNYAGWKSQGQGYMVEIDHGGGIRTEYFHGNGDFYVKAGDRVKQGDPIMYMGTTGNSTGTHLHFILWKDHIAVNPREYVPYRGDY